MLALEERTLPILKSLFEIKGKISMLEERIALEEEQKERAYQQKDEIVEKIDLNTATEEVLEKLVSIISANDIVSLRKLIKQGLGIVFSDKSYDIDIQVSKARGQQGVHFYLIENIDGRVIRSDLKESNGSGVRAVVALLCQVFYIRFLGFTRIVLKDEHLSSLSDEYIENLFLVLRALKDKEGFQFLLVSHDPRLRIYADKRYWVNSGQYREDVEDVLEEKT